MEVAVNVWLRFLIQLARVLEYSSTSTIVLLRIRILRIVLEYLGNTTYPGINITIAKVSA